MIDNVVIMMIVIMIMLIISYLSCIWMVWLYEVLKVTYADNNIYTKRIQKEIDDDDHDADDDHDDDDDANDDWLWSCQ